MNDKQVYMGKIRSGKFIKPVTITVTKSRVELDFGYDPNLIKEIKAMKGHKYHGYDEVDKRKTWSVKNCYRNWFQLRYLMGQNPYEHYLQPLNGLDNIERPLFKNQAEMVKFGIARKQCMFACEMGLGKTLAAIEVMERSGTDDWMWVGPRSALSAARIELDKWGSSIKPIMMTYAGIRIGVQKEDIWIPQGIIFDESSKIKTHTTQQSQAAAIITEEMRKKHKEPYIILMSGAPAPRNPADWWHQLEVACPGFIKEGEYQKFKSRLCIQVEKQGPSGSYPETVAWYDDERRCKTCGQFPEEHSDPLVSQHAWEPSVNEVKLLYKRMNGLVLTQFKKDCLDLPDKHFIRHTLEPKKATLRALGLIKAAATRTITALIQIRELSDGFQYIERESKTDKINCPRCEGSGKSVDYKTDEEGQNIQQNVISCPKCRGTGKVAKVTREVIEETESPKDKLLEDLLDEYEPIGRFVVYAGFQASVDRVCKICKKKRWSVIRVDGRGWSFFDADNRMSEPLQYSSEDMLNHFQNIKSENKICFVGQPGAAGMGLTLTASPAIFFFSNTFNAEDRIQSMDRIHRPGMDLNRGAKIIDVIHLPIDEFILDNLDNKMNLQDLSLGKLKEQM